MPALTRPPCAPIHHSACYALPPPPRPPTAARRSVRRAALPPPTEFTPTPPSTAIIVGSIVPVGVFLYGLFEFTKRIIIQRRCPVCSGSGLVAAASNGRLVKCRECGGFFPWTGWGRFFEATTRPGNGGALLLPRGQAGRLSYRVPTDEERAAVRQRLLERSDGAAAEEVSDGQ